MKKKVIFLLTASMVLGLTFTGCSNIKEKVEEVSKFKDDIEDNIEEVVKLKDDIVEIIDTEVIDGDNISDSDDEKGKFTSDIWGEIAKYKVDNIIEEKPNSGVYILAYISKEKTEELVNYFDDLLKDTEGYDLREVTEKETIIDGYLNGTINGASVIVAVEYDNFKDENRVEFTCYKK